MYDDYEVIYKSNLNEYLIIWIILAVIGLALAIFTIISQSKVYKKANRSGIAPWIPIYNIYLLVEIANLPKSYFLMTLVPILNIYAFYKINMEIARLFKKRKSFGYGLFLLPFVYYPILAFSDSEYIGINIDAIEGKYTVEDIPIIDENKNKEIEVEENTTIDTSTRSVNISIGGGRYQKDYAEKLDSVSQDKILNKATLPKEQNVSSGSFINDERFNEISKKQEEENKQTTDMFNVAFIESDNISTVENKIEEDNKNKEPVNTINGVEIDNNKMAKPELITPTNVSKTVTPEPIEPGLKKCPNCGTKVPEGALVCFICGQRLN